MVDIGKYTRDLLKLVWDVLNSDLQEVNELARGSVVESIMDGVENGDEIQVIQVHQEPLVDELYTKQVAQPNIVATKATRPTKTPHGQLTC